MWQETKSYMLSDLPGREVKTIPQIHKENVALLKSFNS